MVGRLASKEADQLLLQRLLGEAKCNFSAYWFCSANGQANSQADGQGYHQVKARPVSQQRQQTR